MAVPRRLREPSGWTEEESCRTSTGPMEGRIANAEGWSAGYGSTLHRMTCGSARASKKERDDEHDDESITENRIPGIRHLELWFLPLKVLGSVFARLHILLDLIVLLRSRFELIEFIFRLEERYSSSLTCPRSRLRRRHLIVDRFVLHSEQNLSRMIDHRRSSVLVEVVDSSPLARSDVAIAIHVAREIEVERRWRGGLRGRSSSFVGIRMRMSWRRRGEIWRG